MLEEKAIETIKQGLSDELEATVNYILIAAGQGDNKLKKAFLNYAMEELGHAQKLINLLDLLEVESGKIPLEIKECDDVMVTLIEYIAKEESAVFYYEVLNKLHMDLEIQNLCKQIQQEEKRHLNNINEILTKIKSGEYQYD